MKECADCAQRSEVWRQIGAVFEPPRASKEANRSQSVYDREWKENGTDGESVGVEEKHKGLTWRNWEDIGTNRMGCGLFII